MQQNSPHGSVTGPPYLPNVSQHMEHSGIAWPFMVPLNKRLSFNCTQAHRDEEWQPRCFRGTRGAVLDRAKTNALSRGRTRHGRQ